MDQLLDEMVMEIACRATCAGDVVAMALTCKSWKRALCTYKSHIWKALKERHFPGSARNTMNYFVTLCSLANRMKKLWHMFVRFSKEDEILVLEFPGYPRFKEHANILNDYPSAWDREWKRARYDENLFQCFLYNVNPTATIQMYSYVQPTEACGYLMDWSLIDTSLEQCWLLLIDAPPLDEDD